jgi:hypothetical protein
VKARCHVGENSAYLSAFFVFSGIDAILSHEVILKMITTIFRYNIPSALYSRFGCGYFLSVLSPNHLKKNFSQIYLYVAKFTKEGCNE